MKRIVTKVGDIFCAKLEGIGKRYFQYIANDISMLNSSVIRVFKKTYNMGDNPDIQEVVKDDVDFYAHVVLRWGIEKNLWEKVGKTDELGTMDMLFRNTNDYGSKPGEQIKVSNNWYVWKINEPFRHVGKLEGENQKANVGLVINPLGIIQLLKGNKYPPKYPG